MKEGSTMSRKDPYRKEIIRQYKAQQATRDANRASQWHANMAELERARIEEARATSAGAAGWVLVIVGGAAGWFLAQPIGVSHWITLLAGIVVGIVLAALLGAVERAAWRRKTGQ